MDKIEFTEVTGSAVRLRLQFRGSPTDRGPVSPLLFPEHLSGEFPLS